MKSSYFYFLEIEVMCKYFWQNLTIVKDSKVSQLNKLKFEKVLPNICNNVFTGHWKISFVGIWDGSYKFSHMPQLWQLNLRNWNRVVAYFKLCHF